MKKNLFSLFIVYVLTTAMNGQSHIINVPVDYSSIQAGINHAVNGDTVLVSPGYYYENINFRGKSICVASWYITTKNLSMIDNTVIDGSRPANFDSASCVSIVSGEDSTTVLEGFTLMNGLGLRTYWEWYPGWVRTGGGVVIKNSSPTIKNNEFFSNVLPKYTGIDHTRGAGLSSFKNSRAKIYNNVFALNRSDFGAALSTYYDKGTVIKNNLLVYNYNGQTFGGGCISAGLVPEETVIENNTIVYNSSMDMNRSDYCIVLWHNGSLTFRNNIVWGNTYPANHFISLNDNAKVEVSYSDIQGGYTGTGNINLDPGFTGLSCFLTDTSKCIDAGAPDSIYNDPEDTSNLGYALVPSKGITRNDIGAYGGQLAQVLSHFGIVGNKRLVPFPYTSIQMAIDSANNHDSVFVAPGRYYENINFKGKDIIVTSYFSMSGDTSFIRSTIIDGSKPKNADTASCVLFINNETSAAVLEGFTITGGKGTKWTDEHGAGVYREGGGILSALSSPTIVCNIITNNEAIDKTGVTSAGGGGIRAGDGNPVIVDNIIMNNQGRYGAGITLNYTGAYVSNNIISNNSGGQDYGGGALWMNHDGPAPKTIINNTIANNKTVAVYVWQGSSTIKNCIIWADATVSARQIGVNSGGPTVTYSNVYGGYSGEGNIFKNPFFMANSYLLTDTSPCVDNGDPLGQYSDPEDTQNPGMARFPSKKTVMNDMGAYGGPYSILISTFKTPSVAPVPATIKHETADGKSLGLDCFPNPAKDRITIKYVLAQPQKVRLSIYDLSGREICTLFDKLQSAGDYSSDFTTKKLQKGIYILKFDAGTESKIQKMVLE